MIITAYDFKTKQLVDVESENGVLSPRFQPIRNMSQRQRALLVKKLVPVLDVVVVNHLVYNRTDAVQAFQRGCREMIKGSREFNLDELLSLLEAVKAEVPRNEPVQTETFVEEIVSE